VQEKIEIGNRSQEELIKYTKKIGMEAIAKAVDLIYKEEVVLINNDATQKTYYSFPTSSDVKEFLNKGKRFY
jgi:methionyl-tRNA formyltransferase